MTAPTATTSQNRRAAKAVVLNAHDTADARLLLDMLGFVDGPAGREVLPDNTGEVRLADLGRAPGKAGDEPPLRRPSEDSASAGRSTSSTTRTTRSCRADTPTPSAAATSLSRADTGAPNVAAVTDAPADAHQDANVGHEVAPPSDTVEHVPTHPAHLAIAVDALITDAQQSPARPVQRAARSVATALEQLLAALDELDRAERTAGGRP